MATLTPEEERTRGSGSISSSSASTPVSFSLPRQAAEGVGGRGVRGGE